jgi:hypothetical protein
MARKGWLVVASATLSQRDVLGSSPEQSPNPEQFPNPERSRRVAELPTVKGWLPFEEAFDAFDDDFGDGMLDGLL